MNLLEKFVEKMVAASAEAACLAFVQ